MKTYVKEAYYPTWILLERKPKSQVYTQLSVYYNEKQAYDDHNWLKSVGKDVQISKSMGYGR